jgi:prolyl-tRNA synthetase
MRWSKLYAPTLREDPAEAEAISHRLLVRAGFVRQLMAGHYTLLPLAVRVRAKIVDVIRQEMNRIGGQEFIMPTMHPAEIWQKSGRWDKMGQEMFRLRDRKGADLALGMTHEEIFATVALELSSYRELPQIWYQFQTKFRDEPRPKSGLIRVREFTMKDSYSFDLDPEGLDRSFELHREAYVRTFRRLGIPALAVEASSGNMGGSDSVEFMCASGGGEDLVVVCPSCGYAANVEKATSQLAPTIDQVGSARPERFDTPGVRTIEDLAHRYQAPGDRQIKTLVYILDGQPTLVLMRGDHALVEQKLRDSTGAIDVRPAHPDEIRDALGASPGSLGAVGVTHLPMVADEALRDRHNMFTGANVDDFHLRGVDVDRDIRVGQWADLREVLAGEPCPRCGSPLEVLRMLEVGHIFKLGNVYSTTLGVEVLGPDGERINPIMGSYGIGVERAMAAIVECHHDDAGIVWPMQVAPFHVVVTLVNNDHPETTKAAEGLYSQLASRDIDVLLDDRPVRPGVKFNDADLIGVPVRVTVGTRGLTAGTVEIKERASGDPVSVALDEAAGRINSLVHRPTV